MSSEPPSTLAIVGTLFARMTQHGLDLEEVIVERWKDHSETIGMLHSAKVESSIKDRQIRGLSDTIMRMESAAYGGKPQATDQTPVEEIESLYRDLMEARNLFQLILRDLDIATGEITTDKEVEIRNFLSMTSIRFPEQVDATQ